jgi:hypothetical protein
MPVALPSGPDVAPTPNQRVTASVQRVLSDLANETSWPEHYRKDGARGLRWITEAGLDGDARPTTPAAQRAVKNLLSVLRGVQLRMEDEGRQRDAADVKAAAVNLARHHNITPAGTANDPGHKARRDHTARRPGGQL